MPITYQLKPDERLLILIHTGIVTDEEFLSFYKKLYEETRIEKSYNLLIDLRQTESSIRSAEALNELVDVMRKQFVGIATKPKVAVVAPKDVSFGMARMYEFFSADVVPWKFVVFRAIDAALAWLGLSENVINDIDQDVQPEDTPDPD